jgi:hypothetical protein
VALDPELLRDATNARNRLVEIQHDLDRARGDYHHAIRRLHASGGTLREIAEALGLSHQRVHQIVEAVVTTAEPWEHPVFPPMFGSRRKGRRGGKFRHFTERAREAVGFAQEEAAGLHHNAVGTQHLLLGLLRVEDGGAARALGSLGIDVEAVRTEVMRVFGEGDSTGGPLPFTPDAKQTFEVALREALSIGHNHIGTEHILLGLLRVEDPTVDVLRRLGAEPDAIRTKLAA